MRIPDFDNADLGIAALGLIALALAGTAAILAFRGTTDIAIITSIITGITGIATGIAGISRGNGTKNGSSSNTAK